MTYNGDPPDAAHARGLATALLITTFFGAIWGMVGAFALPGIWSPTTSVLVVLVTIILLLGFARLLRISRGLPPVASGNVGINPFVTGPYRLAILFEVIAIPSLLLYSTEVGIRGR